MQQQRDQFQTLKSKALQAKTGAMMAVNGVHFDKSHVYCTDLELHGFIVSVNYPIANRNSICISFEMMDTNGRNRRSASVPRGGCC